MARIKTTKRTRLNRTVTMAGIPVKFDGNLEAEVPDEKLDELLGRDSTLSEVGKTKGEEIVKTKVEATGEAPAETVGVTKESNEDDDAPKEEDEESAEGDGVSGVEDEGNKQDGGQYTKDELEALTKADLVEIGTTIDGYSKTKLDGMKKADIVALILERIK